MNQDISSSQSLSNWASQRLRRRRTFADPQLLDIGLISTANDSNYCKPDWFIKPSNPISNAHEFKGFQNTIIDGELNNNNNGITRITPAPNFLGSYHHYYYSLLAYSSLLNVELAQNNPCLNNNNNITTKTTELCSFGQDDLDCLCKEEEEEEENNVKTVTTTLNDKEDLSVKLLSKDKSKLSFSIDRILGRNNI